MSPTIVILTGWLAERLVAGAFQGTLLVGLAWLVSRPRAGLSAAMQAAIWWVVTLRIVLVFAPLPAVPIPILPAADPVRPAAVVSVGSAVNDAAGAVSHPLPASSPAGAAGWLIALAGIWMLGVVWHASRLLLAWRGTRSALRRSLPSGEDADTARELAAALGLSCPPGVRTSYDILAPQVVGLRHPVVLMPAEASLTPPERLMAIGHEFMHVRRRDLALGWVPAIAERLFFFHPLVRLAAREYVTAREAACDAALVRTLGIAPEEYGRLLVRFGVSGQRLAWSAGGASASATSLRRRLHMLQHLSGHSRRAAWVAAAATVVALVPGHLVARAMPAVPIAQPAVSVDGEASPLLFPATHAAVLQDAPLAVPSAAPAPGADQRAERQERDTARTADRLQERRAELERLLAETQERSVLDAEKEAIAAERRQQEIERVHQSLIDADARLDPLLRDRPQQDLIRETERAMALARREQDAATSQARSELSNALSAARKEGLRLRLEELARQLATLAEMQKQLQRESEQLRHELSAVSLLHPAF